MPSRAKKPGAPRPKSPRNTKTAELEAALAAASQRIGTDVDAHALHVAVYRDPSLPLKLRLEAAKVAYPYERPRLATVEHTGEKGGPIIVQWKPAQS